MSVTVFSLPLADLVAQERDAVEQGLMEKWGGACNFACKRDQQCVNGTCECPPGLTVCADGCVDFQNPSCQDDFDCEADLGEICVCATCIQGPP